MDITESWLHCVWFDQRFICFETYVVAGSRSYSIVVYHSLYHVGLPYSDRWQCLSVVLVCALPQEALLLPDHCTIYSVHWPETS